MTDDFGLFDDEDAPDTDSTAAAAGDEAAPELIYGSAEEFLHEQLLPTYVRNFDPKINKWCLEWYFHPEAVSRIASLWRAWEHLRLDPATGMSVWWRDHADPHMQVLLSTQGPFWKCDMQQHREPPHLKPAIAPAGWFPDVREHQS